MILFEFIIEHNGGAENISDAQVIQAIKDLNDAFGHKAPYDGSEGVDTRIKFCLAIQNPAGNPTTGINRVVSTLTNLDQLTQDKSLKDLIRWDPKSYMNIWLVKDICNGTDCGTAGYAYLAAAHGREIDGIVTEAAWFGSTTNGSKVLVHEVGHYLNLYHTFDGTCANSDCLLNGDRICDTPPDSKNSSSPGCVAENTCTTDADDKSLANPFTADVNDKISNYMDYSGQACQNAFTEGQRERMTIALTGTRASLLNSLACTEPCPTTFDINFAVSSTSINIGESVVFTNNSIGTITNYEWSIDDVSVSTLGVGYTHTFLTEGIHLVKLKGWNTDPLCNEKYYTIPVTVKCPVLPDFKASGTEVGINTTVNFSNTTIDKSLDFKWYVNGIYVGATLPSYTFTIPGVYTVSLEAANGLCAKTKTISIVVINNGGFCTNMDFETGTTANWIGYTAKFDYETSTITPVVPGLSSTRHMIMTEGYDPIVGGTVLSKVAPGGKFSLRLEDTDIGANASIIEQTFLVTAVNANFVYKYALVLENPGHDEASNPFFNIHMTDQSGNPIPCAAYSVIAQPPFTGFTELTGKRIYYKNWTSVAVPLTAYIGQNVKIKFTIADCAMGGHFGYAYIDGSCLPIGIKSKSSSVCAGEKVLLEGPAGFSTYQWSGPGIVGATNLVNSTVNLPGTYTLQVGSDAGSTCKATMSITLNGTVSSLNAGDDVTICKGNSVQLLASQGSIYKWTPSTGLSNPDIADPIASPEETTTYTVSSCGVSDQVTVYVIPNFDLAVTPDISICDNYATISLNALPTPSSGKYTYKWFPQDSLINDAFIQNPIVTLSESRKYYVTVKDLTKGCERKDSVNVVLAPSLSIFPSASPLGLCKNSPVTSVTLTASASLPGTSIKWYEGGSLIGTGTTIVVSPKAKASYVAEGVVGECKTKATVFVPYYAVNGGPDKIICDKELKLNGTYDGDPAACNYQQSSITYENLSIDPTWTSVIMDENSVTDSVRIGFDFQFFCNTYQNIFIASNGYILFDKANGKSAMPQRLPDRDVPNNLIAMGWGDLFCLATNGGAPKCIYYKIFGTAPNRNFKVYFMSYEKGSNPIQPNPIWGHITLFESSNIIEIHLRTVSSYLNNFTVGIENGNGTIANAVAGKNKEKFNSYRVAYRFTPQYNVIYNWLPAPLSGGNTLTPTVRPAATTTYTVTADNGICVSSDQVKVTVDCSPLYVDMLSFEAKLKNEEVQLAWITSKEENHSHFNIERSTDGTHWKVIGAVKGKGTTSALSSYYFTDTRPAAGINYYRLAQYDLYNSLSYSTIKSVNTLTKGFTVSVYPNPFFQNTHIIVNGKENETVALIIKDLTGKVLSQHVVAVNTGLEIGDQLDSGMYFIEVISDDFKKIHKVVKYAMK